MEKIYILMATYNGEKYLVDQIESILNQTYLNFNLIISDDNSTDSTKQILRDYEKKDCRIKVFFNKKNIGSNKNFKRLLKKVNSKFFMFCDQDDIWYENKIEESLKKMREEEADLIFTDLEVVDSNLNVVNKSFNKKKSYYRKIVKYNDLRRVYLYNVVTGCTILCKSKYINDILKFSDNKYILHDHIVALLVSLRGNVTYLNKPTVKYRQHSNNQVGSKRYVEKFTNFYDIRRHLINVKINLFKYYEENNIFFDEQHRAFNKLALMYFNDINSKKYINLKKLSIFYKLYKDESFINFIINFFIMNLPFIVDLVFNLKNILKKGVKNK